MSRKMTDPRKVTETFVNVPHSVYLQGPMIHITLGVERPALDAEPGARFKAEHEVVLRIVLPTDAAKALADGILTSLSPLGQIPLNKTLQS